MSLATLLRIATATTQLGSASAAQPVSSDIDTSLLRNTQAQTRTIEKQMPSQYALKHALEQNLVSYAEPDTTQDYGAPMSMGSVELDDSTTAKFSIGGNPNNPSFIGLAIIQNGRTIEYYQSDHVDGLSVDSDAYHAPEPPIPDVDRPYRQNRLPGMSPEELVELNTHYEQRLLQVNQALHGTGKTGR